MNQSAPALQRKENPSNLTIIKPLVNPGELIQVHQNIRTMIKETLIEGVDYGKVPGASKPSLYKPGAEKICIAFGCSPKYKMIDKEIDHHKEVQWIKRKKVYNNAYQGDKSFSFVEEKGSSFGLYRYMYKATIVRSDGRELGDGDGVSSTLESKFIDRPRDCENNVCKMSQKRAFVAATLNSFGLSDAFTQDIEDMQDALHQDTPPPPKKTYNNKPNNGASNNNPSYNGTKYYVNVGYDDRHEAKKLDPTIQFDSQKKQWYSTNPNSPLLQEKTLSKDGNSATSSMIGAHAFEDVPMDDVFPG